MQTNPADNDYLMNRVTLLTTKCIQSRLSCDAQTLVLMQLDVIPMAIALPVAIAIGINNCGLAPY